MRLRFTLLVSVGLVWAATAHAEQSFPYKAYVVNDEVYVRSGPGKNYYPTSKLKSGQEVEIHRHDPGGWYAIRPPEGSFAWVSGRYLQKKEKGLAVVTGDRVAARVGSELSDIRDVIQVRLERGEMVEILGEKQFSSGSEAGTWYKMAPPSGEFRWIFGKFVDRDFPRDGVRKASSEESPLVRPVRQTTTPAAAKASAVSPEKRSLSAEPSASTAQTAGPRVSLASQTSSKLEPGSVTRSGPVAPKESASVLSPEPAGQASGGTAEKTEAVPMRRISPEEFRAELDAADLQLSMMLAEEPTVWEFGELDKRARSLLAQAETAVERGRARLLVNKIAQAADIKRRSDEVNTTQEEIDRNNRQLAELAQRRAGAMRSADPKAQFDGVGRLTRVVPSKVGEPHYALVDEKGAVRCYVTAAPGVNLRYYEGRQVGINGIRGYISDQNAQHVTAKHVRPLEDRVLR